MITKTILSVSLAVLSLGAVVPAASAQSLTVQIAPPAPRYEVVPAPRRGMVWTPGHWEWRQKRHVWVPGVWMKARPGYVYTQPTWQERNGRWDWRGGEWRRDNARYKDGRRDDRYYGEGRRNDRDGDGVPNRYDNKPGNPNRW